MIVVGISGYADGELLAGCIASVPREWPIVYCDGRVKDYPIPMQFRQTDARAMFGEAIAAGTVRVIEREKPWEDEAEKKTAIAAEAFHCFGPGWLLLLDTDERLEIPNAVECSDTIEAASGNPAIDWLYVNIYRPEHEHAPLGFPIPRIARLCEGLHYRGPHDLHAYIGDKRIGYLDGEPVPEAQRLQSATLPREMLRIRHDRHLRPAERLEANAVYQQTRRARTGH